MESSRSEHFIVLDNALLHDTVPELHPQNSVDMFYECKVIPLDNVLLGLLAAIERYFFSSFHQSRVRMSKVTREGGLCSGVVPKWRSKSSD